MSRQERGVTLFAGPFESQLLNGFEHATSASNIFDAIGALATSKANAPVKTVVLHEDVVLENPRVSIDAIRSIDPSAIIVYSGKQIHQHADASVDVKVTVERLQSAIANASSLPSDYDATDEIDLDDVLGIAEEVSFTQSESQLGDIDLVRSLMHQPTQFRETLLKVLQEQTGWTYCEFINDESCAPETALTTSLRYGHQEHGCLAAIGSTTNDLQRWGRWASCWLELHRKQRDLKLLAYQDELSGAWNRRFLKTCFSRELQLAKETRRPLTVMIFDIDDFKHYNDTWGHDAGDEIIREVVKLLRTIIRKGDHVCRIGGDEFAVLFCDPEPPREPGSNHPTTVEILAKRFREQVSKAHFPKLGEEATGVLSISGGLATFPWDGVDVDSILQKADERLLQSKGQGKNSITIGNPSHKD